MMKALLLLSSLFVLSFGQTSTTVYKLGTSGDSNPGYEIVQMSELQNNPSLFVSEYNNGGINITNGHIDSCCIVVDNLPVSGQTPSALHSQENGLMVPYDSISGSRECFSDISHNVVFGGLSDFSPDAPVTAAHVSSDWYSGACDVSVDTYYLLLKQSSVTPAPVPSQQGPNPYYIDCSSSQTFQLDSNDGLVNIGCSSYGDSVVDTWTYTAGLGGNAMVVIETVNTEFSYDYVKIYDGPSSSSPQLGSYTGSLGTVDATYVSSERSITVVFTSDSSVTYTGFTATMSSSGSTPSPTPQPSRMPMPSASVPAPGEFNCCFYFSSEHQFESSFCQEAQYDCPDVNGFFPVGSSPVSNCDMCDINAKK